MATRSGSTGIDAALWAAVVFIVAAIAYGSLSQVSTPSVDQIDKLFHATGYGTLTFTTLLAGVWRPGRGDGRWPAASAVVVVCAIAFGVAIEIAQGFVGRDSNIWDAAADLAGGVAGLGLWGLLRRRTGPAR
jgi:VanZ family protein